MSFREKTDGGSPSSSRFSGGGAEEEEEEETSAAPHIGLLGHRHRCLLLRDGKQVTVVLQGTPG